MVNNLEMLSTFEQSFHAEKATKLLYFSNTRNKYFIYIIRVPDIED